MPSAKTKGGIWITDPHDRDREPQRVVVIEYQDGWPCSVVTELHWDHSRKPWFKPGRDKPSGTCAEQWDFDYSRTERTLYFHDSGSGGTPKAYVARFVKPDPPPAKLWVAEGVPIVDCGKSGRGVSDATLLKRGYVLIPRPLLLPKPYGGKTRNPFEAGEEGRTVYCGRCEDCLGCDDTNHPCEHIEWCDGCGLWVYADTRQHVEEHEGSLCDCEQDEDEV